MRHFIIGTAGHVDHGKSKLVQALTGTDPDRLAEEKARGMTIDLGFAHLRLSADLEAGIVDVPGHEHFIPNMLAGAGQLDLVLFTVAAEEGVMPQTREHLEILSLLGCQRGILVLTKSDLASPELLVLAQEEVRSTVKGTFLENAPLLAVSAKSGQGIAELRLRITEILQSLPLKAVDPPFRMPVDRVFTLEGFGTVATGTVTHGEFQTGDTLQAFPSGEKLRIRGIESQHVPVESVSVGQRAAVNVRGKVKRGDVLADPETLRATVRIDVRLRLIRGTKREITTGTRLHFYTGTSSTLCRVVLLDRDHLAAGEECFAQLRLESPAAVDPWDTFVIRFYSPEETVGGGVVLDAFASRHKNGDGKAVESCVKKESGSPQDRVEMAVKELFLSGIPEIRMRLPLEERPLCAQNLQSCIENGRILCAGSHFLHRDTLEFLRERFYKALEKFHTKFPLLRGMDRAQAREKLLPGGDHTTADEILSRFVLEKVVREDAGRLSLPDFSIHKTKLQQEIYESLTAGKGSAFVPLAMEETARRFPENSKEIALVLAAMLTNGEAVDIGAGIFLPVQSLVLAQTKVEEKLESQEFLTLAQLRTALGTSRKYAQALLEYWCSQKLLFDSGDHQYRKKG